MANISVMKGRQKNQMKLAIIANWTGGDEPGFGFGSNDLDMDVRLASKEKTLTYWEAGKKLAFS